MDCGCHWSSGNNHSPSGRMRCFVLIASFREPCMRCFDCKKEAFTVVLTVVKRGRAKRDYDRTPTSSEVRVCIAVRARLASSPRPRHAVRFQITSSRCTFHRRDPFQPHREGGIGKDPMIENRWKCKYKLLSSVGRDSCTSAGFQG